MCAVVSDGGKFRVCVRACEGLFDVWNGTGLNFRLNAFSFKN